MKVIIKARSIQARVLAATSIVIVLLVCLPGCHKPDRQTISIPTSTKPTTQSTGLTSSPAQSSTHPNRSVPVTNRPAIPTIFTATASITDMLKVIPDTLAMKSYVWFVDFTAWRKVHNINLDDYTDAFGNIIEGGENQYINDVYLYPIGEYNGVPHGIAPFISGMGRAPPYALDSPIRAGNIGYSPFNIGQSIVAESYKGIAEIIRHEAIKGDFDLTAINQATDKGTNPYYRPQISKFDDIDIYSWDGEIRLDRRFLPPIYDNLGQGRTLAIQEHDIYGSAQKDYTYEMVGVSQEKADSLADNTYFHALASNLEKMGVISAVVSEMVLSYDRYLTEARISEIQLDQDMVELFENADKDAPVMGPYGAFAVGLGKDEKGLFIALVLVYDSLDIATRDIGILKTRLANCRNWEGTLYSDGVRSSEVWADDYTLCARLRGNLITYWARFIWGESLLVRKD